MKKLATLLLFCICLLEGTAQHAEVTSFHFSENKGQFPQEVKYHAKLHVGDVFLEANQFVFDMYSADEIDEYYQAKHSKKARKLGKAFDRPFSKHAYKMKFVGANESPILSPKDQVPGYKNYFIGNDPSKWASNIQSYRGVVYSGMYDYIDMEIYTVFNRMKYDFIVHPGGNPDDILIDYEGVESLELQDGSLIIHLSTGDVKELRPVAFQDYGNDRTDVPCRFEIDGNQVKFVFPEGYDQTQKLVIDPVWVFSTLTGSAADNWGFTATYDTTGNLYAGGIAFGSGYPTVAGSYSTTFSGGDIDIAISKFSSDGTTLIYSTYIGGSANEVPHSLVVDSQDNLVILASTGSSNFPTTGGCYDNTFNGGVSATFSGITYTAGSDIALVKLNTAGSALVGSTYIGGSNNDGLNQAFSYNYSDEVRGEVVVDASDNIYITTSTRSTNFPATPGAYSTASFGQQDAVVVRMNPNLTAMDWGTYLGGSANDAGYSIRLNQAGDVFICGGTNSTNLATTPGVLGPTYNGGTNDGYTASLDGASGTLTDMSYMGTASYDQSFILEIDNAGDVYVTGQSMGAYPVASATYFNAGGKQFIHKMSSDFSTTSYSTTFGATGGTAIDISLTAFLVDNCGNVYVSGWGGTTNNTGNTNGLPVTGDAQQSTTDGSDFYFFVLERDATGLLYASYFGSNTAAEHVDGGTSRFDKEGNVYQAVCAGCGGNTFPTTPGVWSQTNGSTNCNLGAIKFEFDFQGVEATAVDPGDQTLCGAPYDVDFNESSGAPQHYWDFGDGMGTSTAPNPTYTYADSGTYNVMYVAIDPASCNIRDTTYFDVTLIIPETFSAVIDIPPYDPCDTTVSNLTVDLNFTGTGADSLVWDMGDGTTYINNTNVSHTYTSQGTYFVEMIAYDFQCNLTDTILDTVVYNATYTSVTTTPPPDQSFCSAPYDVDFTGDAVPNHYWDFGDGSGTSTSANPTYTYADTGSYTVMYVAIDSNTCNVADTVYFNINLDEVETFDAMLTVPPIDPCSAIDTLWVDFQFTGTGADSIAWDMGDGTTYTNDTLVNHPYTTQGTYYVSMIAYDFDCNFVDTIMDTVNYIATFTSVSATAPPDQMICSAPFDVDFTGDPVPNHYWDFGDGVGTSTSANPTYTYADSGSYTVMYVAIDSSTCNIADTVYFNVDLNLEPELTAVFDLPTVEPCTSPDSLLVTLTFTGDPNAADSIYWDLGDGTTFIDDTVVNHYYTSQGQYVITMEAWDFTCNNYATITDTVDFTLSFSSAVANASPNILACDPPFDVTFDGGTPAPPQSFWDFDDGTTSTMTHPTHTFTDTGHYDIMYVAIDSSTCNIADTVWLTVDILEAEEFSATLDFEPPPPCGMDTMFVHLEFTGTGADSLAWDMGDGTIFIGDTVVDYFYVTPGVYNLQLYAEDTTCNKSETVNNQLVFAGNPNSEVLVPNVFTPNGDDKNDEILFNGVDPAADFTWTIFNRWGKPVFISTQQGQAWDGTNQNNGRKLDEGLYYYELIFRDLCKDEDRIETGFIHLMR